MVFLHSLKWDQALSYAKKILREDFPREEIYVYLIAITDIRMEVGLSQEVQQAAHKVRDHIIHHLADVI
jgi:Ni,Fe-hydrogenase maturation factor